jgi:drug/metabolite transporter (DMT)-like permease
VSRRAALGLAVAVLAISWGAPLARLTDAAPLAVAMWRMTLAVGLLAPLAAVRGDLHVPRRRRAAALLAGLFLGLHFGLWIPSLWLTSVSASVVLVTTQPLWVLLASPRFLGVRIRGRNVASFSLALAGAVVIAWGDFHVSLRALLGDLMALGAAVAMGAYLVVGKRLRSEVPLAGYLTVVYGGAAATLVAGAVVLGVPLAPRSTIAWLPLFAMAAGPTLVGHTLLNWALAHLEAYRVNLAVLLEPVLASLWTWVFIGEAPPLYVLPGASLVLVALGLEFGARRVQV